MRKSRKATIVIGSTVGALAIGGVAFAYWTSSGSGAGSATAGTSSDFVVTTDTATGDPLTPGGPTDTVAFHVNNPSSGAQYLTSVAVTVANSDGTTWTSGSCSAADFTVGTPSFTAGQIAAGGTKDGTVTITMKNLPANQDDCKGVTVPLYVAAS